MPNLLPTVKFREFTALGTSPLIGGTVETYDAGTSTPAATFTDSTGTSANPWPVVLDSQGRADIWIAEDSAVKVVVKDSAGSTQYTVDNVTGVGSGSSGGGSGVQSEWIIQDETPAFVSGQSYTVTGDVREEQHVGRRVRAQAAGISYHTITASEFAVGTTTVTVANDSTPLDGGLAVVSVGILSADNQSAYVDAIAGLGTIVQIGTGDIIMHAGSTPRTGFVWCDGTSYTVAAEPALYAVILDQFTPVPDGGVNFNVPNMNARAPMGFGQGDTGEGGIPGTVRSIGDLVGLEVHKLTHLESGLPSHQHSSPWADSTANEAGGQPPHPLMTLAPGPLGGFAGGINASAAHTIQSPALVVGFMIKT